MENLVVTSLAISGLGMLLLFVALLILYGLMYWMTSALHDPAPKAKPSGQEAQGVAPKTTAMQQAAAIAVALARARQAPSPAAGESEAAGSGSVSPWWTMHHQQQLARDLHTRRIQ